MKPIRLPLSALREPHACELDERIAAFTEKHGIAPDDTTTLRAWLEVTPAMADVLWATRCLGRAGRILGLEVATRAARRALAAVGWDHVEDDRPLRAIEAAEVILADLWAGREPPAEMRQVARAAADAADAAAEAAYAAADAAYAAAAAAAAAYAAAEAAYAAAVAYAAAYAAATQRAEQRAAQRADFLAVLDRLECVRGDR